MIALRCSALPLAFLCPGSARAAELLIDERNAQGDLGTCAHEALRALPEAGRIDWDGVPQLARRHNVSELEDDLRMLLALGQKHWSESLRESFPDAMTEVPVEYEERTFKLTGTIDLYSRKGNRVHLLDWKSGRLDRDYSEQLKGYAALALLSDETIESATAYVVWLREGEVEQYTMTRAELPEYLRRLRAAVLNWDQVYHPGSHCEHCPRSHECPARQALVRRDVAAFLGGELTDYAVGEDALARLPAATKVALLASADVVQKLAERLRHAMREHVERSGDIVADGVRLTVTRTQRRNLKVIPTFPVLDAAGFTDDDFERCCEVRLSEAEKIVAERAPYRGGAKAKTLLRAELEAAGAIETTEVKQLVTRRAAS